MKLQLARTIFNDEVTVGKLYINQQYFCDTLEDYYRDLNYDKKIPGKTSIPFGTYKIILNESPKFKRLLPRLINVPGFEGILIHAGNDKDDTAGCILVGKYDGNNKLTNSRWHENELVRQIKYAISNNEEITIEIV